MDRFPAIKNESKGILGVGKGNPSFLSDFWLTLAIVRHSA